MPAAERGESAQQTGEAIAEAEYPRHVLPAFEPLVIHYELELARLSLLKEKGLKDGFQRPDDGFLSSEARLLSQMGDYPKALEAAGAISSKSVRFGAYVGMATEMEARTDADRKLLRSVVESATGIMKIAWNDGKVGQLFDLAFLARRHRISAAAIIREIDHEMEWGRWKQGRIYEDYIQHLLDLDRREQLKPKSKRSPKNVETFLDKAHGYFASPDYARGEGIVGHADAFYQAWANVRGVDYALAAIEDITYVPTKIAALVGVTVAAARSNSDDFGRVMTKLSEVIAGRGGVHFLGKPEEALRMVFERAIPAWLEHADGDEYVPFAVDWLGSTAREYNHRMQGLGVSLYATFHLAEAAKRLEAQSAAESCDPATRASLLTRVNSLRESVQRQTEAAFAAYREIPTLEKHRDSSIHYSEAGYVLRLLTYLDQPTRPDYERLASELLSVDFHTDTWAKPTFHDWAYAAVSRELAYAGYYTDSLRIARQIIEPNEKLQMVLWIADMAIDRSKRLIGQDLTKDDIVQTAQDTQLSNQEFEALGFATDLKRITVKDIVSETSLSDEQKIFFLMGRSQQDDDRHKALNQAVAMIRAGKVSGPAIEAFIRRLVSSQEYKVVNTQLFALLDYKKTDDYGTKLNLPEYAPMVVIALVEAGNQKGISLASRLFANEAFGIAHPDAQQRLMDVLFAKEYWPKDLQAYLTKSGAQPVEERYRRLLAYMIRVYRMAASKDILDCLKVNGDETSYEDMVATLDTVYAYGDRYETVLSPVEMARVLMADQMGLRAYYLRHAGEDRYGYVNRYGFETFVQVLRATGSIGVDPVRFSVFGDYLRKMGRTEGETQAIMQSLLNGEYPFGEGWAFGPAIACRETYYGVTDVEFEEQLALSSLHTMLRTDLWALRVTRMSGHAPETLAAARAFALSEEPADQTESRFRASSLLFDLGTALTLESMRRFLAVDVRYAKFFRDSPADWRGALRQHIADAGVPVGSPAFAELKPDLEVLLNTLEGIERQKIEPKSRKQYEIAFVEKGKSIFRFLRAVDAVPECVNSASPLAHVAYMYRRLADPLSWTIDIRDTETQVIIGNVEMRLGINAVSGDFELFCVGLYSGGKTRAYTQAVFTMIERTIATPLRLRAINIGSKHGGVILKPFGYGEVKGMGAVSYSPLTRLDGSTVLARGDDIPDDYDWNHQLDFNVPFAFTGFRKELGYGFTQ